ncbi:MBL fold metallo-hydrolase [Microbulbifer flavimaris]|uniref:MBL fold metallo-hydrolase n=1 Tax=Microbulbifer flavimaris TaxID=1781068 RepID=A0ABX4HWY5_9GAMM|nr:MULTISPECIES: rhodanese-like domain-containing protein [Microbulbifer]KUJ80264.1 hydrolase [Microbulbifer sp. ZGT114]PCO04328.1 MBL fold metallo-hydrolase [Microbulbifer flavimaris]
MFVESIKSPGLAQLSYLIGDGGEAAVIDPRRDCEIYAEKAREKGCRITHIFETHRNEDLISGAPILAQLTGAAVHHGPNPAGDVTYADTVREGDDFTFGSMRLKVLETPGHTDDSLSFAIYDQDFGDQAIGVFTGDALFVGDVGRTDFYPDRKEEVAGLLYDSLQKILSLGNQAILYPAHGAGSVCGDNMADRDFSTLGYERKYNPMLQIGDRKKFIEKKVAEHHEQPPYFRNMEQLNLDGSAPAARVVTPPVLDADDFYRLIEKAEVIDVRGVTAYLGAHIPGSLAIPCDMIPAFAGWFLDPEDEIVLVADSSSQAQAAARHLARIGFDRVPGFLNTALPGWAAAARPFSSTAVVDADTVKARVQGEDRDWQLLDVRGKKEVEQGTVPGATTIYLGHLPEQLQRLPKGGHYTVMCASGARATIGASILQRSGFENVDVFLGSMGAWKASGNSVIE